MTSTQGEKVSYTIPPVISLLDTFLQHDLGGAICNYAYLNIDRHLSILKEQVRHVAKTDVVKPTALTLEKTLYYSFKTYKYPVMHYDCAWIPPQTLKEEDEETMKMCQTFNLNFLEWVIIMEEKLVDATLWTNTNPQSPQFGTFLLHFEGHIYPIKQTWMGVVTAFSDWCQQKSITEKSRTLKGWIRLGQHRLPNTQITFSEYIIHLYYKK